MSSVSANLTPGTLVAIVEQHVDARGEELVVEAFGGFTDSG